MGTKLLIQLFDNVADNIQVHGNLHPTILAAILEITQAVGGDRWLVDGICVHMRE